MCLVKQTLMSPVQYVRLLWVCVLTVEWIEWLVEGICHPVCVCVSGVEVHLCAHTRMHIPDQGKTPTGTGPEELCPNSPDPACSSPD